ncbi:PREDICTED: lysophosphatidylcholine acyltransferase 2B-like [Chinchilla lanigera]|uniref:lysophosphatidylcholine acyltransferase 2B-like n=1 Tax=Chinchilla lanigera TaxID=34839 RepID=UPI0006972298|nr:PREDICTED: lysophosphatidylcholine acyltransferase 2B-like [Chinchilla lanigera]
MRAELSVGSETEIWETAVMQERSQSLYSPVANPFLQQTHISAWRWARAILLGTVLVPMRVACLAFLFILLWPVVVLSTFGLPAQRVEPTKSWRKNLMKPVLTFLFQVAIFFWGFMVKVKGKKATRDEAHIFVTAPHSTFFDAIACVEAGLPSVVSASQNVQVPIGGKLLLLTDPVLVTREDPDSRKNTRNEILKRVTSGRKWPQILIFPEGIKMVS